MKIIFLLFVLVAAVYGGGSQFDVCSSKPSWEDCEDKTTYQGFTFNGTIGVCEALTFTGCKPGGNFFKKMEDCESVCVSGDTKLGFLGLVLRLGELIYGLG